MRLRTVGRSFMSTRVSMRYVYLANPAFYDFQKRKTRAEASKIATFTSADLSYSIVAFRGNSDLHVIHCPCASSCGHI